MLEFDYSLLKNKIKMDFSSESNFVKALKNSNIQTNMTDFSNKLNNKLSFSQDEIIEICNLLEIPIKDSIKYFFVEKHELNS